MTVATPVGIRAGHKRRTATLAGGLLAALVGLWMVCCTQVPSASATVLASPLCSRTTPLGCARTPAIAHVSSSEAEEPEEELEEGTEEAATAEVEAEEGGSEESGSTSDRSTPHAGVALSDLRLTAQATVALAHHRPPASAIGFSFTLSAPAEVRVTLVKQASSHERTRWVALPDSLSLRAKQGRASHDLTGHNRLSPGRYRLTLKPAGGRSHAIYLNARQ